MTDIQFSQLLEVLSAAVCTVAFAIGYLGGVS